MKMNTKRLKAIYKGSTANSSLNRYITEDEMRECYESTIRLKAEFNTLKRYANS